MKRMALAFPLMCLLLSLYSCRSVKYVPVETVRTEYKTKDSIRRDSIHITDSIFFSVKGDTVYKYVGRVEYKYLYVDRKDTVFKADTIQVPYPVEQKISTAKKIGMYAAGMGIGILLAGVVVAIIAWRKK